MALQHTLTRAYAGSSQLSSLRGEACTFHNTSTGHSGISARDLLRLAERALPRAARNSPCTTCHRRNFHIGSDETNSRVTHSLADPGFGIPMFSRFTRGGEHPGFGRARLKRKILFQHHRAHTRCSAVSQLLSLTLQCTNSRCDVGLAGRAIS